MKRIDHIDIVKIRCRRLIRDVHRMRKRQIPDRKRLVLGIARFDAADIFVIQLA